MGIRGELSLFTTAINNDYPITPETRRALVDTALAIMSNPSSSERERISAGKLIIAADLANERKAQNGMDSEMLLMIAEQNGIKDDVLRIVTERKGAANSECNIVDEIEGQQQRQ